MAILGSAMTGGQEVASSNLAIPTISFLTVLISFNYSSLVLRDSTDAVDYNRMFFCVCVVCFDCRNPWPLPLLTVIKRDVILRPC